MVPQRRGASAGHAAQLNAADLLLSFRSGPHGKALHRPAHGLDGLALRLGALLSPHTKGNVLDHLPSAKPQSARS